MAELIPLRFRQLLRNRKDITYLPLGHSFLYLSTIYDLYNNEVIAYKISTRNDIRLVLDTVKKAIRNRKTRGILLHSDRDTSIPSQLLKRHGIHASMSRKGNCHDNACISFDFGGYYNKPFFYEKQ